MSEATMTQTRTYTFDEAHSTARFWVRHMMISKVHGEFSDLTGRVAFAPSAPEEATVEANIGVASLTTNQDQRDAHLKSADFFDAEKFPAIHFKSTSIRKTGDEAFDVTGDLTIHGVTKPVTFKTTITPEVKNPNGGYKIGFSVTGMLNREDFGMTWNQALEAGGVLVGKEVNFEIDGEMDRGA